MRIDTTLRLYVDLVLFMPCPRCTAIAEVYTPREHNVSHQEIDINCGTCGYHAAALARHPTDHTRVGYVHIKDSE